MRIDKLLSNLKYGTRKEIKDMIRAGLVFVNDKVMKNADYKIDHLNDKITIKGVLVENIRQINLALYKPKNYLSANKDNMHQTVIELIKEPYSRYDLKIAGRLDLDSEGLLLLTSSGSLAYEITSPNSKLSKVYEVKLDIDFVDINKLLQGVIIKDGKNEEYFAKALKIESIDKKTVLITIDEGKFHQVKRMFRAIGYEVLNLKRIQIGKLTIGNLKPGEYIEFKKEDIF